MTFLIGFFCGLATAFIVCYLELAHYLDEGKQEEEAR